MKKQKKSSSFKGKVGRDAQKQQQQGSSYGYLKLPKGLNVFKDEPRRMYFDIMPYVVTEPRHPDRDDTEGIAQPGELWYKRPFKVHRNIGSDNETYVCPTSIGKKCPICEYRAKRLKEGAEKEETDALKASLRNLYIIIPKDKKFEAEPYVYDVSQFLFQNRLNLEIEDQGEKYETFPDLEEGWLMRVRYIEKSMGKNKFNEATSINFEPREEPYDEEIMEDIPDVDAMLTILTYEKLEQVFFEMEDEEPSKEAVEDEDDEEEEEKPRAKKSRKPEPEPEPEEDDDDDEEEDDDEEPEPAPKRKKPVKKPEPEEDDDDDDDDEEEPEPAPKKGKKKSSNNDCPYGHKFGKDFEKFDECDSCEKWDDCMDAKENA